METHDQNYEKDHPFKSSLLPASGKQKKAKLNGKNIYQIHITESPKVSIF
jgi:hypothetical protein